MYILSAFIRMWTNIRVNNYVFVSGTSSPQSLKKILSLSEEASERHRRHLDDSTVSNASSQLPSPPGSPQSSPKKGKLPIWHCGALPPPAAWPVHCT